MGELVLNFNDAILYQADIDILRDLTAWLNDACIHFYFTYLQTKVPRTKVLFMDPSVITFLMHQCDDEDLQEFSQSFQVPSKYLIIPINDGHGSSNSWKRPGSGSHWSLLVVGLAATGGTKHDYWYLDSVRGSGNAQAAREVAQRITEVIEGDANSADITIQSVPSTPQQRNGHDCGLHCLAFASVFCTVPESLKEIEDDVSASPDGTTMRKLVLEAVERAIQERDGVEAGE
eukprot:CAMPEP_0194070928 /NCGR_PEP_ID=MMETSP0009_2-20130614/88436_1 /TAXON_ID=210454 /ORGANISM="Grammatophora oceanica, Strain CCMP 410" /LENGTH=231 /DNA_ID=CAMNT_0038724215 /DNA_START=64 /DNA_END=759 /DNA_ORIENTATION=-